MDLFIHYTTLPEGMTHDDLVEGLNQVLEDGGFVNGGQTGRIDVELEEEKHNPKLAQGAVKSYLQRVGMPRDTLIELGCMRIELYA